MASPTTYADRFSDQFQLRILATAARDPGFMSRYLDVLRPSYFSGDVLAKISKHLIDLFAAHRTLPSKLSLLESIRPTINADDVVSYEDVIKQMYRMPLEDAPIVRSMVIEFAQSAAMVEAVVKSMTFIEAGDLAKVRPAIDEAYKVGTSSRAEAWNWRTADRELIHDEDEFGMRTDVVPTGIHHLDIALKGGFGLGEVSMLIAPNKRGKTHFCVNAGLGAATAMRRDDSTRAGFNVVHFTLEVSRKRVAARYDRRAIGTTPRRHDPVDFDRRLKQYMGLFLRGSLHIYEYPTGLLNANMLRSQLSVLSADGFPPDLVIVDYADLMAPLVRREVRFQLEDIYRDLRAIAGEFNCHIHTPTQGNKETQSLDIIGTQGAAEAWAKNAIVDLVLTYNETPQEEANNKCRIVIAAGREVMQGVSVMCRRDLARSMYVSESMFNSGTPRHMPKSDSPVSAKVREAIQKGGGHG